MMNSRDFNFLVAQYVDCLKSAFTELERQIASSELELIATFLVKNMSGDKRDYHDANHPLQVAQGLSPLAKISALFHDIVYVQIDGDERADLFELIYPFQAQNNEVNVKKILSNNSDPWIHFIARVFNVEQATNLHISSSLNEFLSALVLYKTMLPHLKDHELAHALACIECTVPFRKVNQQGKRPAEELAERLTSAGEISEKFIFSTSDIISILKDCSAITQRDLRSFGVEDPAEFISYTWKVIYETNPQVQNIDYTATDYRKAMSGTQAFLGSLNPAVLFWTDNPPTDTHLVLQRRAKRNLSNGVLYLRSLAVFAGFIEACQTYADKPILWRNIIQNQPTFKLSHKLHDSIREIYNILNQGRSIPSRFDESKNLYTANLISTLTQDSINSLFEKLASFISSKISPEEFIRSLPETFVNQSFDAFQKNSIISQAATNKIVKALGPFHKVA